VSRIWWSVVTDLASRNVSALGPKWAWTLIMTVLVVAGAASMAASAQENTSKPAPDSDYVRLLARLKRGDTLIDFGSLRMAYANSSAYDPSSSRDAFLRHLLRDALGTGDLHTVASLADSLLADNPPDVEGHVLAAYAAREGGDSVAAQLHAAIARGLGRSYDGAHHGASLRSPIVLIAASEEEYYGRLSGLEYTDSTKLVECPAGYCDVVVFKNPRTGSDTTLYFDVTLQVRWMLQHRQK
jgi:hypothetical protein